MKKIIRLFLLQILIFSSLGSSPTSLWASDFQALLEAAREGNLETVIHLVDKGVPVINEHETGGHDSVQYHECALREAVNHGRQEVIDYLLTKSQMAKNDLTNELNFALRRSPKHPNLLPGLDRLAFYATQENRNISVTSAISLCGPDEQTNYRAAFEVIFNHPMDVHYNDEFFVFAAAYRGQADLVKFFLERGADPKKAVERWGDRALQALQKYVSEI